MRHRFKPIAITTGLRIARDPCRFISVANYWTEFDEPIDLLNDPQATFMSDEMDLISICEMHGIAYQRDRGLTFPVWLLREFYPANP